MFGVKCAKEGDPSGAGEPRKRPARVHQGREGQTLVQRHVERSAQRAQMSGLRGVPAGFFGDDEGEFEEQMLEIRFGVREVPGVVSKKKSKEGKGDFRDEQKPRGKSVNNGISAFTRYIPRVLPPITFGKPQRPLRGSLVVKPNGFVKHR